MKSERQARILEIISKHEIKTQEEITARLQSEGFKATQATVSRDLRELKLTKRMGSSGAYRYTSPGVYESSVSVKLNSTMLESITGVRYSMNNVVIKTYPGLAMAVASGVDALNLDGVLGCIGGDDTIMIVTRNEDISLEISENIKDLIKGI